MPCLYGSGMWHYALMSSGLMTSTTLPGAGPPRHFASMCSRRLTSMSCPCSESRRTYSPSLPAQLEAVPEVFAWASYATLVLAVLLTGHVVARETGRPARGLIAMAAVGFSSVLGPSLLYYAASQALAAGIMILVMLAFFQSWHVRGSWWLLASGLVAAMAAPLFWTAGYSAGPVGAAYLMADGRRSCQHAAACRWLSHRSCSR